MPAGEEAEVSVKGGFFPDAQVMVRAAEEEWSDKDRDLVLEEFCAGRSSPRHLARRLGRTPKAIKRLIEGFVRNERNRVLRYHPVYRTSRQGKKWTKNELIILKAHAEEKIDPVYTARLLCRHADELDLTPKAEIAKIKREAEGIAPTLDLIWAHRYLYFVYHRPVITNRAYDDLVKEEIEYGKGAKAFSEIKHHEGWPDYIISLALYLLQRETWRVK